MNNNSNNFFGTFPSDNDFRISDNSSTISTSSSDNSINYSFTTYNSDTDSISTTDTLVSDISNHFIINDDSPQNFTNEIVLNVPNQTNVIFMPIEIRRIIQIYQDIRNSIISRYNDENPAPDKLLEIINKYNEMGQDPEFYMNNQTISYYAYKACHFQIEVRGLLGDNIL